MVILQYGAPILANPTWSSGAIALFCAAFVRRARNLASGAAACVAAPPGDLASHGSVVMWPHHYEANEDEQRYQSTRGADSRQQLPDRILRRSRPRPSPASRRSTKRTLRFCATPSRAIAATRLFERIGYAPAIRSCGCAPRSTRRSTRAVRMASSRVRACSRPRVTRPDLFGNYYREQLRLLAKNHHVQIEVGVSDQPIPIHFAFAEGIHLEGDLDRERLFLMRDMFDTPDLALLDDRIVNGTYEPLPGEPHPLALFTAARVDFSLHRLKHYTATLAHALPELRAVHELPVLYRRVRQTRPHDDGPYRRRGTARLPQRIHVVRRTRRRRHVQRESRRTAEHEGTAPPRLPQMPAYHLKRADGSGITMINIGVGPSNAKTITDHIAVLRPHAWIMLGHCAGLRNTQRLGDYVLAHGYVREDHVLDDDLAAVGADSGARRSAGGAGARGRAGHAAGRRRTEARDAHGHGGERRQPQLGVARSSRAGAAALAKPRGCTRHGKRDDRRERLPFPRALRHACCACRTSPCMAN